MGREGSGGLGGVGKSIWWAVRCWEGLGGPPGGP